MAAFVRDACDGPVPRSKKALSADEVLKKLTEVIEHLQYVVTEGCFEELRDMVGGWNDDGQVGGWVVG